MQAIRAILHLQNKHNASTVVWRFEREDAADAAEGQPSVPAEDHLIYHRDI